MKAFIFTFSGMLKEFSGWLELTENLVPTALKSMNWTKQKGTTEKMEPSEKFLEEKKLIIGRT